MIQKIKGAHMGPWKLVLFLALTLNCYSQESKLHQHVSKLNSESWQEREQANTEITKYFSGQLSTPKAIELFNFAQGLYHQEPEIRMRVAMVLKKLGIEPAYVGKVITKGTLYKDKIDPRDKYMDLVQKDIASPNPIAQQEALDGVEGVLVKSVFNLDSEAKNKLITSILTLVNSENDSISDLAVLKVEALSKNQSELLIKSLIAMNMKPERGNKLFKIFSQVMADTIYNVATGAPLMPIQKEIFRYLYFQDDGHMTRTLDSLDHILRRIDPEKVYDALEEARKNDPEYAGKIVAKFSDEKVPLQRKIEMLRWFGADLYKKSKKVAHLVQRLAKNKGPLQEASYISLRAWYGENFAHAEEFEKIALDRLKKLAKETKDKDKYSHFLNLYSKDKSKVKEALRYFAKRIEQFKAIRAKKRGFYDEQYEELFLINTHLLIRSIREEDPEIAKGAMMINLSCGYHRQSLGTGCFLAQLRTGQNANSKEVKKLTNFLASLGRLPDFFDKLSPCIQLDSKKECWDNDQLKQALKKVIDNPDQGDNFYWYMLMLSGNQKEVWELGKDSSNPKVVSIYQDKRNGLNLEAKARVFQTEPKAKTTER